MLNGLQKFVYCTKHLYQAVDIAAKLSSDYRISFPTIFFLISCIIGVKVDTPRSETYNRISEWRIHIVEWHIVQLWDDFTGFYIIWV